MSVSSDGRKVPIWLLLLAFVLVVGILLLPVLFAPGENIHFSSDTPADSADAVDLPEDIAEALGDYTQGKAQGDTKLVAQGLEKIAGLILGGRLTQEQAQELLTGIKHMPDTPVGVEDLWPDILDNLLDAVDQGVITSEQLAEFMKGLKTGNPEEDLLWAEITIALRRMAKGNSTEAIEGKRVLDWLLASGVLDGWELMVQDIAEEEFGVENVPPELMQRLQR